MSRAERNKRLAAVIRAIQDSPEQWDQTVYHGECGTTHCFAGWADLHSGTAPLKYPECKMREETTVVKRFLRKDKIEVKNVLTDEFAEYRRWLDSTRYRAAVYLQLDYEEADYLFDPSRTFKELYDWVQTQVARPQDLPRLEIP